MWYVWFGLVSEATRWSVGVLLLLLLLLLLLSLLLLLLVVFVCIM